MPNYYDDWKQSSFNCKQCAWTGLGSELVQGEKPRDLFEVCCPNCGRVISVVLLPTLEESRENWDKLSELDKHAVETMEARQKDSSGRRLSDPEELPDIAGDDLEILWDIEHFEGGDTMLRHGNIVLWREPSFYEGYERYLDVGQILLQKYGSRLKDFIPTQESRLYLYGDSTSAADKVDQFRERLKRGECSSTSSGTNPGWTK